VRRVSTRPRHPVRCAARPRPSHAAEPNHQCSASAIALQAPSARSPAPSAQPPTPSPRPDIR